MQSSTFNAAAQRDTIVDKSCILPYISQASLNYSQVLNYELKIELKCFDFFEIHGVNATSRHNDIMILNMIVMKLNIFFYFLN